VVGVFLVLSHPQTTGPHSAQLTVARSECGWGRQTLWPSAWVKETAKAGFYGYF